MQRSQQQLETRSNSDSTASNSLFASTPPKQCSPRCGSHANYPSRARRPFFPKSLIKHKSPSYLFCCQPIFMIRPPNETTKEWCPDHDPFSALSSDERKTTSNQRYHTRPPNRVSDTLDKMLQRASHMYIFPRSPRSIPATPLGVWVRLLCCYLP